MQSNNLLLFWGGIYSNWYPSKFVIDNTTYYTVEQWMMAQKAITFGDIASFNKIMHEGDDPRVCKALGRKVKGYNDRVWNNLRFNIVKAGVKAKFEQNRDLLEQMRQDLSKTIVEASPYDTIWGIGLAEDDPDARNPKKWRGMNLLGKAIMAARLEIFKEDIVNV